MIYRNLFEILNKIEYLKLGLIEITRCSYLQPDDSNWGLTWRRIVFKRIFTKMKFFLWKETLSVSRLFVRLYS